MSDVILGAIISGLVSLFAGAGGVFVYLNNKQKTKQDAHESAISEWKNLYDEMRKRLDEQEKENKDLRTELLQLKQHVNNLTIELQNYKKYDTYISELDKYVDHLLHTSKSLMTDEAYKNISSKRPRRSII